MSILKTESYAASCDHCGDDFESQHEGFTIFPEDQTLQEMIDEAGWHTEEGRLFEHNRHYCDKCHWVDDADEMHLRIERKDIVSKRDVAQPTPSTLSPEIGEGGEMARHKDIPAEDMAKLYKYCETWNENFAPFVLKGLVQGYLLAIGKLPRYHYDEAGYCGTHEQPFYNVCPLCNPDNPAAQPTETPATGKVPAIPKMSDELAAMADVAAIDYGKDNGQRVCREEDDYDNSPDLTDAFLAGQSWMYHKMQQEITQLKASLEESRNDAKVFQEWYRMGDANVISLTEQLGAAQEARDLYKRQIDKIFEKHRREEDGSLSGEHGIH